MCECIYRMKLDTRAQAKQMIDDYIWFYNHKRLQQRSRMTPLEMRNLALL